LIFSLFYCLYKAVTDAQLTPRKQFFAFSNLAECSLDNIPFDNSIAPFEHL
jgi:hypothetical protein